MAQAKFSLGFATAIVLKLQVRPSGVCAAPSVELTSRRPRQFVFDGCFEKEFAVQDPRQHGRSTS